MVITVYDDNFDVKNGTIYIDAYINYYINNLQPYIEEDGNKYFDGGNAASNFIDNLLPSLYNNPQFEKWLKDEKLNKLHKELTANGMKLCPLNFFTLCKYILTVIDEQYFLLMKPTINDTLAELNEVKGISFINGEGKSITSNNKQLIKTVLDSLQNQSNNYEVHSFVRASKMTDKILLQSSFAYSVAYFLKDYFKDYPRRGNCCMVSAKEQKLILYMLYFFGLAPEGLTPSRFRQMIMYHKQHQMRVSYSKMPYLGTIQMEIILYEDWKNGVVKLDKLKGKVDEGFTLTFPEDFKQNI